MEKPPALIAVLASFLAVGAPLVASAACSDAGYQNPLANSALGEICSVQDLLLALVELVFLIGVPIIVIFIIYGGFLFVKSGDNESELAKAKNVFMWTLIGALVLLGAKAISLAIQGTIDSLN